MKLPIYIYEVKTDNNNKKLKHEITQILNIKQKYFSNA